ncbi:MAG TPA: phosphotransferase [Thermomicrobiales bacterium]|nr:phosphotransferase [Thermomicrobiales bacterium]
MLPSSPFFADVGAAFGLGTPVSDPLPVTGGLSNRLYRLQTDQGEFAIKRMVANAETESFKSNVESSFRVEQLAYAAGIVMPAPVPVAATNEALARIDDGERGCWVRVHRWVSAAPLHAEPLAPDDIGIVAGMLATLHQIPAPAVHDRFPQLPVRDWRTALPQEPGSSDLLHAIGVLEKIIDGGYSTASPARAMSHRDLDPKNVLRAMNGELVLVDWDAAGPVITEWDVVTTALDWSNVRGETVSTGAFDHFLSAYAAAGGDTNPVTAGSFAGWCEGVLDWLWFNLDRASSTNPIERQLGTSEVSLSVRFIPTAAQWITAHS